MSDSKKKIFPLYKSGVFQYEMRQETPKDRINRLEQAMTKANQKTDLLVCPELFMSGYGNPVDIKK